MNDVEKDEILRQLKHMVMNYCQTEKGRWITQLEWGKIPVELRDDLKDDVMGMYSFGKIVLRGSYDARLIFSTYVHELRHRWQWVTNPITYIIGKVIRPLIERDAYRQENIADDWINNQNTI